MLGLYDSGLGGLTVLAALRAAGIDQDVVYFADQAHVPYGDKTDAQIHGYLGENLALLRDHGVDAVVTACNTSCAVAGKLGWPATTLPVLDLIATAGASLAQTPHRRIAVVATAATVRSGAYARAIAAHAPHVEVVERAAPALVPLVEAGAAESDDARAAVFAVAATLPEVDAIVYGCTHYPLLDRWFADALGAAVIRIDPAQAQAEAARALVARLGLTPGAGTTTYYTNGDPAAFDAGVRRLGGGAGRVLSLIAPYASR
ncbi:glutamate racemase [Vulcanimicrobium alpinum]|uniref:Glutamate racemase n=1 Tax=Vulcanimicrobium alpinum TaxID=3016050 RepID=A0AAN2C920_UNVUL|nr:aspartate/glutamate racemase family protein [Vulcanimicrobium alpinum]BDE05864.1 glutamate racemase [Vulcanimicrobium alpinum]